jgi:hypothetical protein
MKNTIKDKDGNEYSRGIYYKTTRATGNQQWVANEWAKGALPTHSVSGDSVKLYTSTDNFRGYQYPDGRGKLMHYAHIQAIRTYSGLILCDSSCYAKGWARCSTPNDNDGYFDITTLKAKLRGEDVGIYDIEEYDDGDIQFSDGSEYDVEHWEWIGQPVQTPVRL